MIFSTVITVRDIPSYQWLTCSNVYQYVYVYHINTYYTYYIWQA